MPSLVVCLIWIFHDIRIRDLTDSMTSINWWWVAGAVFFDILSYVCQGMRWSLSAASPRPRLDISSD